MRSERRSSAPGKALPPRGAAARSAGRRQARPLPLLALPLALALALGGCAVRRSPVAPPGELADARTLRAPTGGEAVLFVVRSDGFFINCSVSLDGSVVGWLGREDFLRIPVTPGAHRIGFTLGGSPEDGQADGYRATGTFNARPGDVFLVGTGVEGGDWSNRTGPVVAVLDDGGPAAPVVDRVWGLPSTGELKTLIQKGELVLPEGGAVVAGVPGSPAPSARAPGPAAGPLPRTPPAGHPAPTPPFAAGAAQPHAFALVIGVEKYRDLPAPTGARGDAQQFAELARKTLGVPERNVILALDDRAAKSDLEKHLAWLENNVPAGGRIYLFFAGHGAPDPTSGTSYLLPYDADPAALDGTALKLSDVTARLGKTKARDVVAFLDSCFSGTGGRSVIAAGTRPLVPVQKLLAAPKVSILAAVTGAQTSGAYSGGGGLFSHFLLEAIGTGRADHDGDGQITLREVSEWIGTRVELEAKRDSRDQLPSLTPGAGVDPAQAVLAIGVTGG